MTSAAETTEARTTMGKYSEMMMDHVLSPRNGGVMESPDLTGHSPLGGERGGAADLCGSGELARDQRNRWLAT